MTARLALTVGQSARARREISSGPLQADAVDPGDDPSRAAEQGEALELALWPVTATAEHARITISACDDPGGLARDAYTYARLPIVAGIVATAVANNLLIAAPRQALDGVGVAMILGGPALYLLGESLLGWRMTGAMNAKSVAVAALLVLLVPLGGQISVLVLSLIVASPLPALAVWELRSGDAMTGLTPEAS
jgi:low temperature requirement protein LtrA